MDLFELEAVLRLNTTEFDKGVSDAEESGTGLITKIGTAWTKAKSKFQTVSTILKPVTDLIGDVVDKYSNYQQLTGGIAKLFGDSAERVMRDAKAAFSAAGMSINDYLEMTTSMASSLIQGLEGDTETAADLVNMAVIDMADNVNTFGRSVEDVQNAYRGLARGNYTMLDNLSLGYQGTAAEMERLMEDAAALDEEFAKSAVFGMDEKGHLNANYADMIRAIHIIQQNMGITGTTREESEKTVSGSNATMKAALDNLKTIMGDPKATQEEIKKASDDFTKALHVWLQNIKPIIATAIRSLVTVITEVVPDLMQEVPDFIGTLASVFSSILRDRQVWDAVFQMVKAIIKGLADGAGSLLLEPFIAITDGVEAVNDFLANPFGFEAISKREGDIRTMLNRMPEGYIDPKTGHMRTEQTESYETDEHGVAIRKRQSYYELVDGQWVQQLMEYIIEDGFEAAVTKEPMTIPVTSTAELELLNRKYGNAAATTNAGIFSGGFMPFGTTPSIKNPQFSVTGSTTFDAQTVYVGGTVMSVEAARGKGEEGYNAKGAWDVPFDDYIARLHRDEMVLTASQARDYREGRTDGSSDVVAAVQRLGNELANLKIIVGEKVFGQTVVDYGGKGMNNYLGKSESRAYAGYGWG